MVVMAMPRQYTIELSNDLSDYLESLAENDQRTIEQIILETIAAYHGREVLNDMTASLELQTDAELWIAATIRLNPLDEARLRWLLQENSDRPLSDSEVIQLDILSARLDQYMMLRSVALSILQKRGHALPERLTQDNL